MQCLSPISVKKKAINGGGTMPVPCGRCLPCLQNKRADWSIRIYNEIKGSKSAFFVTLTYDELTLPVNKYDIPELCKRDVQLFLKRLRVLNEKVDQYIQYGVDNETYVKVWPKIKYYLVGEYGELEDRPHYHIILFNLKHQGLIEEAWSRNSIPMGIVHIGNVEPASIHYVTGYLINNIKPNQFRTKPFALMSKYLGFGYVKDSLQYHRENQNFYITKADGIKQQLPRYYKDALFTEGQKAAHARRMQVIQDRLNDTRTKKIEDLGSNIFQYDLEQKKQLIDNFNRKSKKGKL